MIAEQATEIFYRKTKVEMLRKKLGGYSDIESKDLNESMKRFKFSNEN